MLVTMSRSESVNRDQRTCDKSAQSEWLRSRATIAQSLWHRTLQRTARNYCPVQGRPKLNEGKNSLVRHKLHLCACERLQPGSCHPVEWAFGENLRPSCMETCMICAGGATEDMQNQGATRVTNAMKPIFRRSVALD